MRFRPHPVVTPLTVLALIVLIGLGHWQLQRLEWKRDLQAQIDERATGEAMDIADLPHGLMIGDAAGPEWEYQRVRAEGVFDHDEERHLWAVLEQGSGWRILTPLQITIDGDPTSITVMVDRGLAPLTLKDQAARAANLPEGSVWVEGLMRSPRARGWSDPDNDAGANEWYWLDLDAMTERIEGFTAPFIITALRDPNAPAPPYGGSSRTELSNRHLEYVVTWWGIAAGLLGVYLVWHASQGRLTLRRGPV